jgi:hypothetical protein
MLRSGPFAVARKASGHGHAAHVDRQVVAQACREPEELVRIQGVTSPRRIA